MANKAQYYGTGRRKSSVARVRLVSGKGKIVINNKSIDEYFGLETLKVIVKQPLTATETLGKFDVGVPSEIWLRKPQWKEGNQILAADNGVLKEALLFEPEKGKFDGMFTWTQKSDMPRKTVEFIFDRSIKPGEKWSCTCKISESK